MKIDDSEPETEPTETKMRPSSVPVINNRGSNQSLTSTSSSSSILAGSTNRLHANETSPRIQSGLNLNQNLKRPIIPKPVGALSFQKVDKLFQDLDFKQPWVNVPKTTKDIDLSQISKTLNKIVIAPDKIFEFNKSDLKFICNIGAGEYGSVDKVLHKPTGTLMALKTIRSNIESSDQSIKELKVVTECSDCLSVVQLYGVKLNREIGECLICMELMDTSLDKLYKYVYEDEKSQIPEAILGQILLSVLIALNTLKEKYHIIHRDVKPSNILINRKGEVKMCDFGISGKLVDSMAKSRVGCQPYMAPERIDVNRMNEYYTVGSDVWSLGITMFELSTGRFPYPRWNGIFQQLDSVVKGKAPELDDPRLSEEFREFVNKCLIKDDKERPLYTALLKHTCIKKSVEMRESVQMSEYVTPIIDAIESKKKPSQNIVSS